ncbi:MAG: aminotransferase class V-fold PLP-dependent enzyme [Holophagaceae bacterium]|uniref:cysteine desulfurase n=1 Tax=Candidatus Geothrix odensensis TaxID=2954440 RepID=A0A936F1E3_9BACT|nr:aminotransferase class V-fold PLP-dependent enzyme [Candidatus Geothrix odensensis]
MTLLNLPIPPEVKMIYLDNGATSFPKPQVVYERMDTFYRSAGVNPGRSGFDLCLEAGALVDDTRHLLCDFFGGTDPNRLVFSYNSTDALNLAIWGSLQPGDHIVTTHVEHNATLRPLWKLEQEGSPVDWVDFDETGYVDPAEIIRRFRPDTKACVMNHASNVIGTVQDAAAIGAACRERGIRFILDVSQSAGMVPVKMDELNADIVCFTGHKSLMGPMGIGGMYVREGVELRRTRAGGTGVKSVQRQHLDEYPYRMEYGTPNLPGIAGLNAGVAWVNQLGLATIHQHEMALWRLLRDALREIEGVTLYCAEDIPGRERISVLSFNVEGLEAADVGTMLDVDHNIACRTGLHCTPMVHEHLGTAHHGAVRFGIGAFNHEAHIQAAIEGVREIAAAGRRRAGKLATGAMA